MSSVDQILEARRLFNPKLTRAEVVSSLGASREQNGTGFDDVEGLETEYKDYLNATREPITQVASKNLSSGVDMLQANLQGAGALGLETFGVQKDTPILGGVRKSLEESAIANMEEAGRNQTTISGFTDIGRTGNTLRDIADFAVGGLAQQGPDLVSTVGAAVVGGGIPGLAAKAGVQKLVSEGVKSKVKSSLKKKIFKDDIKDMFKDGLIDKAQKNKLEGILRQSPDTFRIKATRMLRKEKGQNLPKGAFEATSPRYLNELSKLSAQGAAFADGVVQASGQTFNELNNEGVDSFNRVAASLSNGLVSGFLDSLVEVGLGKSIFRSLERGKGPRFKEGTAFERPVDITGIPNQRGVVPTTPVDTFQVGGFVQPGVRPTRQAPQQLGGRVEVNSVGPVGEPVGPLSTRVRKETDPIDSAKRIDAEVTTVGDEVPTIQQLKAGAQKVDLALTPSTRSFLRAFGEKAATVGFAEGTTEVLQEIMQEIAVVAADPNREFDAASLNKRLINAFAAGGLVGSTLGGGAGALEFFNDRRREQNPEKPSDYVFTIEAGEETSVPDQEAPEPQTPLGLEARSSSTGPTIIPPKQPKGPRKPSASRATIVLPPRGTKSGFERYQDFQRVQTNLFRNLRENKNPLVQLRLLHDQLQGDQKQLVALALEELENDSLALQGFHELISAQPETINEAVIAEALDVAKDVSIIGRAESFIREELSKGGLLVTSESGRRAKLLQSVLNDKALTRRKGALYEIVNAILTGADLKGVNENLIVPMQNAVLPEIQAEQAAAREAKFVEDFAVLARREELNNRVAEGVARIQSERERVQAEAAVEAEAEKIEALREEIRADRRAAEKIQKDANEAVARTAFQARLEKMFRSIHLVNNIAEVDQEVFRPIAAGIANNTPTEVRKDIVEVFKKAFIAASDEKDLDAAVEVILKYEPILPAQAVTNLLTAFETFQNIADIPTEKTSEDGLVEPKKVEEVQVDTPTNTPTNTERKTQPTADVEEALKPTEEERAKVDTPEAKAPKKFEVGDPIIFPSRNEKGEASFLIQGNIISKTGDRAVVQTRDKISTYNVPISDLREDKDTSASLIPEGTEVRALDPRTNLPVTGTVVRDLQGTVQVQVDEDTTITVPRGSVLTAKSAPTKLRNYAPVYRPLNPTNVESLSKKDLKVTPLSVLGNKKEGLTNPVFGDEEKPHMYAVVLNEGSESVRFVPIQQRNHTQIRKATIGKADPNTFILDTLKEDLDANNRIIDVENAARRDSKQYIAPVLKRANKQGKELGKPESLKTMRDRGSLPKDSRVIGVIGTDRELSYKDLKAPLGGFIDATSSRTSTQGVAKVATKPKISKSREGVESDVGEISRDPSAPQGINQEASLFGDINESTLLEKEISTDGVNETFVTNGLRSVRVEMFQSGFDPKNANEVRNWLDNHEDFPAVDTLVDEELKRATAEGTSLKISDIKDTIAEKIAESKLGDVVVEQEAEPEVEQEAEPEPEIDLQDTKYKDLNSFVAAVKDVATRAEDFESLSTVKGLTNIVKGLIASVPDAKAFFENYKALKNASAAYTVDNSIAHLLLANDIASVLKDEKKLQDDPDTVTSQMPEFNDEAQRTEKELREDAQTQGQDTSARVPDGVGADQILRELRRDGMNLSQDTLSYIEELLNFIGPSLFDDVSLLIGNRIKGGVFTYAKRLVELGINTARNPDTLVDTLLHELWHSLEPMLPPSYVRRLQEDFDKARAKFSKDTGLGFVFADPNITKERFDNLNEYQKTFFKRQEDGSYAFTYDRETYRLSNLAEWFAENMSKRTLKDFNPNKETKGFIAHLKRILQGFLKAIKRMMGLDLYGEILDAYRDQALKTGTTQSPLTNDTESFLIFGESGFSAVKGLRKKAVYNGEVDGLLRYEVDDSSSVYNVDLVKQMLDLAAELDEDGNRTVPFKLKNLLDHPTLYKAYPELAEMTLTIVESNKTGGFFATGDLELFSESARQALQFGVDGELPADTIRREAAKQAAQFGLNLMSVNFTGDPLLDHATLLHEVQHAIQFIEGFEGGNNHQTARRLMMERRSWVEEFIDSLEKRAGELTQRGGNERKLAKKLALDAEILRRGLNAVDQLRDITSGVAPKNKAGELIARGFAESAAYTLYTYSAGEAEANKVMGSFFKAFKVKAPTESFVSPEMVWSDTEINADLGIGRSETYSQNVAAINAIRKRKRDNQKLDIETDIAEKNYVQDIVRGIINDIGNSQGFQNTLTRLGLTGSNLFTTFRKLGLSNLEKSYNSLQDYLDNDFNPPPGLAIDQNATIQGLPWQDSRGKALKNAFSEISDVLNRTSDKLGAIEKQIKKSTEEEAKAISKQIQWADRKADAERILNSANSTDVEKKKATSELRTSEKKLKEFAKDEKKATRNRERAEAGKIVQRKVVNELRKAQEDLSRKLGVVKDVNLRSKITLPNFSASVNTLLQSGNILGADAYARGTSRDYDLTSQGLTQAEIDRLIIDLKQHLEAREAIGDDAMTQVYRDLKKAYEVLADKSLDKDEQVYTTNRFMRFVKVAAEGSKAKVSGTRFGRTVSNLINKFTSEVSTISSRLKLLGEKSQVFERGIKKATDSKLEDTMFREMARISKKIFEQRVTPDEASLLSAGSGSLVDKGRIDEVVQELRGNYGHIYSTISDLDAFEKNLLGYLKAQRDVSMFITSQNQRAGLGIADDGLAASLRARAGEVFTRQAQDVGYYTFSHSPNQTFVDNIMSISLERADKVKLTDALNTVKAMLSDDTDLATFRSTVLGELAGFLDSTEAGSNNIRNFMDDLVESTIHRVFVKDASGVTSESISAEDATTAWSNSDGTLIGFLDTLYEDQFDTADQTSENYFEFVNTNAREVIRLINSVKSIEENSSPSTIGDAAGINVAARKVLLTARELERWPDRGSSYALFNAEENHLVANQVARAIAFGRDMEDLNGALESLFKEIGVVAGRFDTLKGTASKNLGAPDGYPYRGDLLDPKRHRKTVKDVERRMHDEMLRLLREQGLSESAAKAQLKELHQKSLLRNLPVDIAKNLSNYFTNTEGVSSREGTLNSLWSLIVGGTLETIQSSIQQFNELFSPILVYGANRSSLKMTADQFRNVFGKNGVLGMFSELFLGSNVFGIDPALARLNDVTGGIDPSSMRSIYEVNFQATNNRDNQPGMVEAMAKRLHRAMKFQVREGESVKIRPLSPFSMSNLLLAQSNILSGMKSMLTVVQAGINFYNQNQGAFNDPTYKISADDLQAQHGEQLQDFLDAFQEFSNIDMDSLIRKAIALNQQGVDGYGLLSEDLIIAIRGFVESRVTLNANLSNTPSAGLRGFWGAAMTMYGFMFRRGNQIMGLRLDNNDQTYKDSTAVALKRMALLSASVAVPALFIGMLRDEYYERILGKKRNVRSLKDVFNGDLNNAFFTATEQLSATGALGWLGDGIDLVNVAAGEGTNRGLSIDKRVYLASVITNVWGAGKSAILMGEPFNYNRVVRPLVQSLGGSGLLSSMQVINQASDTVLGKGVFQAEYETTKRINAQNFMRVAGRTAGLEVRTFSGSFSAPTKMTGALSRLERAVYTGNPGDYRRAWVEAVLFAIDAGKAKNRAEAESYLKKTMTSRHPLKKVFQSLTNQEYKRMILTADPRARKSIQEAVSRYNQFLQSIGAPIYEGSTDASR